MAKRERSLFGLGLLVAAGAAFYLFRRLLGDEDRERQVAAPKQSAPAPTPAPLQRESKPLPAPPAADAPADDLTEINGIGDTYARRLRAAGIRTFADLAALTPEAARTAAKAQPWQGDPADWIAQAQDRVESGD